jgi:hypothetical protein
MDEIVVFVHYVQDLCLQKLFQMFWVSVKPTALNTMTKNLSSPLYVTLIRQYCLPEEV